MPDGQSTTFTFARIVIENQITIMRALAVILADNTKNHDVALLTNNMADTSAIWLELTHA